MDGILRQKWNMTSITLFPVKCNHLKLAEHYPLIPFKGSGLCVCKTEWIVCVVDMRQILMQRVDVKNTRVTLISCCKQINPEPSKSKC